MPPDASVSQRLMSGANNAADYQQLKVSHDMEIEATRKLYESMRKKLGSDAAAKHELKRRGYSLELLK